MRRVTPALKTIMFELKINNETTLHPDPGTAVGKFAESAHITQEHWAPIYNAVASLGSGKSFYDNDTGAVITNLY